MEGNPTAGETGGNMEKGLVGMVNSREWGRPGGGWGWLGYGLVKVRAFLWSGAWAGGGGGGLCLAMDL